MLATSIAARIFFIPFLCVGIALLRWNHRITRASIVAQDAYVEALGVGWMRRLWERNRAWYQRFGRVVTIAVGGVFVIVALARIILPNG